jgi:hypothetical protein
MEAPLGGQVVFKFLTPSGVSGAPGPSDRLILQHETIASGATSTARYAEHVLPALMT